MQKARKGKKQAPESRYKEVSNGEDSTLRALDPDPRQNLVKTESFVHKRRLASGSHRVSGVKAHT